MGYTQLLGATGSCTGVKIDVTTCTRFKQKANVGCGAQQFKKKLLLMDQPDNDALTPSEVDGVGMCIACCNCCHGFVTNRI